VTGPRKAVSGPRQDATSNFNTSAIMAVTKGDEMGESSTAAAKQLLKPNSNGIANYELPW
jgi:hypothetical protein